MSSGRSSAIEGYPVTMQPHQGGYRAIVGSVRQRVQGAYVENYPPKAKDRVFKVINNTRSETKFIFTHRIDDKSSDTEECWDIMIKNS